MRTYTNYLSDYQTLTKNTTSANQTLGALNLNDSIRTIASIRNGKWKWLETVEQIKTISNKQTYQVPNNIRKVSDVYVQVGTGTTAAIWMPVMVFDPKRWKEVLSSRLGTGDIPRFVYIENDKMHFSPIPSTNGNTIYVRGRLDLRDLSIADYTTGTIVTAPYTATLTGALAVGATSATLNANWTLPTDSYQMTFSSGEERIVTLTNGANTVTWTDALTATATTAVTVSSEEGGSLITGSGTTWTAGFIGRYIRIANTSAANGGDGFWYKITDVLSTTVLVLEKEYEGSAISAGSATYTIGQVPPIPEAYQSAPLWRMVAIYWDIQGDKQAERYWRLYDGGVEAGLSKDYGGLISQMLDESGATEEGSYISPNGYEAWRMNPNNPEPPVPLSSF